MSKTLSDPGAGFVARVATGERVRGHFVRRLKGLIAEADGERRAVLELALREALVRFGLHAGDAP